jgi:hypothetical protein
MARSRGLGDVYKRQVLVNAGIGVNVMDCPITPENIIDEFLLD